MCDKEQRVSWQIIKTIKNNDEMQKVVEALPEDYFTDDKKLGDSDIGVKNIEKYIPAKTVAQISVNLSNSQIGEFLNDRFTPDAGLFLSKKEKEDIASKTMLWVDDVEFCRDDVFEQLTEGLDNQKDLIRNHNWMK